MPRLKENQVWFESVELPQYSLSQAVNSTKALTAVPRKILELMNVPGLTRENVKWGFTAPETVIGSSFISSQEAALMGPLSPLTGLTLQKTLAYCCRPTSCTKCTATLQARNLFSFENPKLRFGEGNSNYLNSGKQTNLASWNPNHHGAKAASKLAPFITLSLGSMKLYAIQCPMQAQ
ncbi:hypothetical protein NC652_022248 [Populus alba x Populus x berolinensis]|nr:hypothetical protein NC652_022248 [Populus alba x Populus x berolinensis]